MVQRAVERVNPETLYSAIRYRPGLWNRNGATTGIASNAVTQYEVSGNCLSVHSLQGPAPIFVRLHNTRNPWIRLKPRMTIRRRFTRLYFTIGDVFEYNATVGLIVTGVGQVSEMPEALCYISEHADGTNGSMFDYTTPLQGVNSGFATFLTFVPAGPNWLAVANSSNFGTEPVQPLYPTTRDGGILMLRVPTGQPPCEIAYGAFASQDTSGVEGRGFELRATDPPLTIPLAGNFVERMGGLLARGTTGAIGAAVHANTNLQLLWSPYEMDAQQFDVSQNAKLDVVT